MILTWIDPAPAEGVPGEVLDCFTVPDGVVELVFCDKELSFVYEDGHSVHTIDYDAGQCPKCGVKDGEAHTCKNPIFEADEMAVNAYRVELLVKFLQAGGYTPAQIADALSGNSDAMAEVANRVDY